MTIVSASDLQNSVDELHENGLEQGLSIGWPGFDNYFRLVKGQLNVVTGIPNHGKSSWTKNMAYLMSQNHDWKWAVYCPEDWPLARYVLDIIGLMEEKNPFNLTKKKVIDAISWVKKHFCFIFAEEDKLTLSYIMNDVRTVADEVDGVIFDPWNQIQHEVPAKQPRNQYIEDALSAVRLCARRKELSWWIVAHPSKMYNKQDKNYEIPRLYDIKGSSAWYDVADNGFTVFRNVGDDDNERYGDQTDVHIQKIRYQGINGQLGMYSFDYRLDCDKYIDNGGI